MKYLKSLLLKILCCIFVFNLSTPLYASSQMNDENNYLESIKQKYLESYSYYVYIPSNMNDFLILDDNVILDEFFGIKITKRLLNKNLELDINKVKYEDLVKLDDEDDFQNNNLSSTFQMVMPDIIGGGSLNGTYSLPYGVKSVVVSSYCENIDDSEDYYYRQEHYLSNAAAAEFLKEEPTSSSFKSAYNLVMTFLGLNTKNCSGLCATLYSIIMGVNLVISDNFYDKLEKIVNSGNKAKISVRQSSYSVTTWTNDQYYVKNGVEGSYYVTSDVDYFNN